MKVNTSSPVLVQDRWLTDLQVNVSFGESGVPYGWYEVLLSVHWDPKNRDGTRFAHTHLFSSTTRREAHPLHSEAIQADTLVQISYGKQLLRGNTVFMAPGTDRIGIEVWQNSGQPLEVDYAELDVTPLTAA